MMPNDERAWSDIGSRIALLGAQFIGERNLKQIARDRWESCQHRLAEIETVLIAATGEQCDILTNLKTLVAERDELSERSRWRPISEIHEDNGDHVLVNLDDPAYMELGSNLDHDFDASLWTACVPVPRLTTKDADRLMAEAEEKSK